MPGTAKNDWSGPTAAIHPAALATGPLAEL